MPLSLSGCLFDLNEREVSALSLTNVSHSNGLRPTEDSPFQAYPVLGDHREGIRLIKATQAVRDESRTPRVMCVVLCGQLSGVFGARGCFRLMNRIMLNRHNAPLALHIKKQQQQGRCIVGSLFWVLLGSNREKVLLQKKNNWARESPFRTCQQLLRMLTLFYFIFCFIFMYVQACARARPMSSNHVNEGIQRV